MNETSTSRSTHTAACIAHVERYPGAQCTCERLCDSACSCGAPRSTNITEQSLKLFLAYARDAGNWSGTPCIGGNVGGTKEERGNITQLKKAGLITTFASDGSSFVQFTPAGRALATQHGIEIDS